MKMVKARLHNRLSDDNLPRLMRIAIGPKLESVNFEEILDISTFLQCATIERGGVDYYGHGACSTWSTFA